MIKRIKTEDFPLKLGYACKMNICLIEGKKGFIIAENDLVHSVFTGEEEEIVLPVGKIDDILLDGYCGYTITLTIKDIKKFLGEAVNLKKWVHYFGIKDRIYRNYKLFQESCEEIQANIKFPEWGKN
jgi:hypothetical protein